MLCNPHPCGVDSLILPPVRPLCFYSTSAVRIATLSEALADTTKTGCVDKMCADHIAVVSMTM